MDNETFSEHSQKLISDFIALFNETISEDECLITTAYVTFYTFGALGLLSNAFLLVIIIINRRSLLKQPVTILLLNLAVADIAFLISNLVTLEIQYARRHPSSKYKLIDSALATFWIEADGLLSDFTVACVAVFNFILVMWPLRSRVWLTKRRAVYVVVALWIVCGLLGLPAGLVLYQDKHVSFFKITENQTIASYLTGESLLYLMLVDCVRIALPILVVLTLYPIMIRRIWTQLNKPGGTVKREAIKHLLFVCELVFLNVGLRAAFDISFFYIAYSTPYLVIPPYSPTVKRWSVYYVVMLYPTTFFHTILNPIVHALSTDNFMKYYAPCWQVTARRNSSKKSRMSSVKSSRDSTVYQVATK